MLEYNQNSSINGVNNSVNLHLDGGYKKWNNRHLKKTVAIRT